MGTAGHLHEHRAQCPLFSTTLSLQHGACLSYPTEQPARSGAAQDLLLLFSWGFYHLSILDVAHLGTGGRWHHIHAWLLPMVFKYLYFFLIYNYIHILSLKKLSSYVSTPVGKHPSSLRCDEFSKMGDFGEDALRPTPTITRESWQKGEDNLREEVEETHKHRTSSGCYWGKGRPQRPTAGVTPSLLRFLLHHFRGPKNEARGLAGKVTLFTMKMGPGGTQHCSHFDQECWV